MTRHEWDELVGRLCKELGLGDCGARGDIGPGARLNTAGVPDGVVRDWLLEHAGCDDAGLDRFIHQGPGEAWVWVNPYRYDEGES